MELTLNDKVENQIQALLVSPKNNRLYEYYINGLPDKRTMLQKKMLQFCIDLCPDHASEIRRCIFEIHPFIIYPQDQQFKELKENDPPKINRKNILFPMSQKIKYDEIGLLKDNGDTICKIAKNFSIWDNYNIHLESIITKNKKKSLFQIF